MLEHPLIVSASAASESLRQFRIIRAECYLCILRFSQEDEASFARICLNYSGDFSMLSILIFQFNARMTLAVHSGFKQAVRIIPLTSA